MFTRTPYGATNAVAAFIALMDEVLLHGISDHAIVYIGDILIFSKTSFHDHIKHIQSIFDRLR